MVIYFTDGVLLMSWSSFRGVPREDTWGSLLKAHQAGFFKWGCGFYSLLICYDVPL